MTVFALHGFLGSGDDWKLIKNQLSSFNWITPSLFSDEVKLDTYSTFDTVVETLRRTHLIRSQTQRTFLGYSLGGRIGLHWLAKYPQDFEKWIFLSTHPGLSSDHERQTRLQSDQSWVQMINNLDQKAFLEHWNQQNVFLNTTHLDFALTNWNKDRLAIGLLNLGLSKQQDLSNEIEKYKDKIIWITGAQDLKFSQMAQKLKKDGKILHLHILDGGHRIYLDQPEQIALLIN